MKIRRLSVIAFVAIATGAAAQTQGGAPPAGERPDPVQTYLAQKAEEFQASERAAQSLNRGGDVTSLYNLLRDKGPFRSSPVRGKSPAEQEQVRDALTRTTAYYLASVGMTPAELNRLQRAGLDPLASGAAVVAGRPGLGDALTVAQNAVIARVVSNDPSAGNPIQRTIRFEPVRVIKGSAVTEAFSLQIELPNPPAGAEVGATYLLFLSQDLAGFRRAAGRRVSGGTLSPQLPPLLVRGDQIVGTEPGQEGMESTMSQLDAFLQKHSGAFNSNSGGAQK